MSTNNSNNKSSGGGISFIGALTIAFIVLKLCNVINWSWLWVLSPIWIVTLLVILYIVLLLWVFKRHG